MHQEEEVLHFEGKFHSLMVARTWASKGYKIIHAELTVCFQNLKDI